MFIFTTFKNTGAWLRSGGGESIAVGGSIGGGGGVCYRISNTRFEIPILSFSWVAVKNISRKTSVTHF